MILVRLFDFGYYADKSRWITELQSVIKGSAELLAMWETVKNESVPGGTLQFGFGDVEMR